MHAVSCLRIISRFDSDLIYNMHFGLYNHPGPQQYQWTPVIIFTQTDQQTHIVLFSKFENTFLSDMILYVVNFILK